MIQWSALCTCIAGAWVPSLVRELRSHMPCSMTPSPQKESKMIDSNWSGGKRNHMQEGPEAFTGSVPGTPTSLTVLSEVCLKRVGWILEDSLWKPSKGEFTFNVKGNKSAHNAFEQGSGKMKTSMAEGETVYSPSASVVQGRGGDAVNPLWERRGSTGAWMETARGGGAGSLTPCLRAPAGWYQCHVAGNKSKLSLLLGVLPSETLITSFFLSRNLLYPRRWPWVSSLSASMSPGF